MKKGDALEHLQITAVAAEGKCVARHNGLVVFLSGGAPGDTVTAEVTRVKSSFLEAGVVKIEKESPQRTQPFCEHFGLCGGCTWQHLTYAAQLHYKQQQVEDHLARIGGLQWKSFSPIIGAPATRHYRNRLDFTFTARRWLTPEEMAAAETEGAAQPGLGYHLPRQYDKVFEVRNCYLQAEPSNAIRLAARQLAMENRIPFFDLRKQTGFLRTLTVRSSNQGEVMVILQVTYDNMEWIEKILGGLVQQFPAITSAQYIINGKRNDSFADLDVICWHGNPCITEQMQRPDGGGPLFFRVGPKSFYQTNSHQAEVLYNTVWNLARLTGTEHVYDLYTGTGTIACFVANGAKAVVGLEYVAAAVEDARANARLNRIENASFFAGDMKELLRPEFIAQNGRPDVVITDPPRAGMHEAVCRTLLDAAPQRIVYVSCNAATQARDLQLFKEVYEVAAVQPVDMFPQTTHVENVALLQRRR
jgi:23S rRNA (uracil1939-C5)-methyltransferase